MFDKLITSYEIIFNHKLDFQLTNISSLALEFANFRIVLNKEQISNSNAVLKLNYIFSDLNLTDLQSVQLDAQQAFKPSIYRIIFPEGKFNVIYFCNTNNTIPKFLISRNSTLIFSKYYGEINFTIEPLGEIVFSSLGMNCKEIAQASNSMVKSCKISNSSTQNITVSNLIFRYLYNILNTHEDHRLDKLNDITIIRRLLLSDITSFIELNNDNDLKTSSPFTLIKTHFSVLAGICSRAQNMFPSLPLELNSKIINLMKFSAINFHETKSQQDTNINLAEHSEDTSKKHDKKYDLELLPSSIDHFDHIQALLIGQGFASLND